MQNLRIYIIAFVLLLSGVSLFAQEEGVKFNASVSKSKLGINERLKIEFSMNQDGDNFMPPDFEGFRVLMGPNQSESSMDQREKELFQVLHLLFVAP